MTWVLLAILAMLYIVTPLIVFFLWAEIIGLRKELTALRQRVVDLEHGRAATARAPASVAPAAMADRPAAPVTAVPAAAAAVVASAPAAAKPVAPAPAAAVAAPVAAQRIEEKPTAPAPAAVEPVAPKPAPVAPAEVKPAPAAPPVVTRAPAPAAASGAVAVAGTAPAPTTPPVVARAPAAALAVGAAGVAGGSRPPTPPRPPAATPSVPRNLEEQLGVRLSVWVGAIALALAGIFLVKYAFDHDLLGPTLRVALGVVFGAGLVAGGEWARIRRSGRIGAGLSAAGIAVLYASFLAATDVYHMLPTVVGFGLMALTTAVAVGLSLRQGPIIAVIGLVGGFLTPYLLRSDTPDPQALPLFLYLLFLEYGLMAVAERRRWWWLPLVTLASGLGWVMLWLAGEFDPADAALLYVFLAASVGGFLASRSVEQSREVAADRGSARLLGWLGVVPPLLLAAVVVSMAGFRPLDWLFLGLLGAGCLALAWRRPDYEPVAWLAAGATALLLGAWYFGSLRASDGSPRTFVLATLGLGAMYALGAYAALWQSATPARWAALSASAALAYFLVGCAWMLDAELKVASAGVALTLAAAYIGLAAPLSRRRAALAEGPLALAALATAATAFLSLAVPLALSRQWIAVAWALEVPALVWLARRLEVPVLRRLAWPLVGLVGVRLLLNPFVLDYPIGQTPVLNWLGYGYGVPIAAFALAAVWSHQDGDEALSRLLQGLAMLLGFTFLTLEVRHFFGHGELTRLDDRRALLEAATHSVVWLAYGLGLLHLGRRVAVGVVSRGGALVTFAGLAAAILGSGLLLSPFLWRQGVGEQPLVSWLWYVYGVPAALAFLAARELRRTERMPKETTYSVQAAGLFLVWLLVTSLVRQWFHHPFLNEGGVGLVEAATYCILWLAAGIGLLELGRRLGDRVWSLGGLAFVAVGVIATLLGPGFAQSPLLNHEAVGRWFLLNWLPYVYGVPAVLAFVAGWQLRRSEGLPKNTPQVVEAAGLVFVWLLVTSLVRQWFHHPFLDEGTIGLVESASYCIAWLALGVGLLELGRRVRYPLWSGGGLAFVAAGVLATLGGPGLLHNPLLNHLAVGGPALLNWLLYAYGLPAALVFLAAWEMRRSTTLRVPPAVITAVDALGLVLVFGLVTLLVRQIFYPTYLDAGLMENAERNAYSLAWAAYGLALLAIGIRWRSKLLRYASLAVMMLTVAKVFLYDMANVGELYRVFSFLGLGASLFALAWLYQRFVFKADAPAEVPS